MLAAAGGLEVAMLVNAATFLVVGVAAIVVRCPHSEFCLAPEPPVGRAWTGAKYLVQDRVLAVVMTVAFVSLLFMTTNWAANVFFAKQDLGLGDVGYGLLLTSWTAGMVLGATLLPRRVGAGVLAVGALVAIAVQGAGLAGPALWLVPALAFAFFFVGGVAHGTKNVLVRTLIHERVPSSLHGRAFAAYNGLRNAAELVALVAGGRACEHDRRSLDDAAGRRDPGGRRARRARGQSAAPGRADGERGTRLVVGSVRARGRGLSRRGRARRRGARLLRFASASAR